MGQLGFKPNRRLVYRGLPLANTPSDCPDTSLQYPSRHWITSFQMVADTWKGGTDFVFVKTFHATFVPNCRTM